jgi:hypothetical protein
MNALQHLTVLPTTAAERANFAEQAVLEIISGERSPLEAQVMLTSLEKLIELIRKDKRVQDALISELIKWPNRTASVKGADITLKERRTFDFNHCQDTVWEQLDSQIKVLTERKKEREAFLKAMTAPVGNIQTGEIINPPLVWVSEIPTVTERRSK